jgi:hypothetical protein
MPCLDTMASEAYKRFWAPSTQYSKARGSLNGALTSIVSGNPYTLSRELFLISAKLISNLQKRVDGRYSLIDCNRLIFFYMNIDRPSRTNQSTLNAGLRLGFASLSLSADETVTCHSVQVDGQDTNQMIQLMEAFLDRRPAQIISLTATEPLIPQPNGAATPS